MQKIATRVFIYASVAFGIFGILGVLSSGTGDSDPKPILMKLMVATGFVVLSSFALSVAGKYLNGK
jgi:hypothetical protein